MDTEDREHFKTIARASLKPPTGLSNRLNGASSVSDHAPDYLLNRARTLFSCYRKDEANEPETYCAAIAAILGDGYSREVVEYVTDPRTGLPSRQKFLPTVAEVREACDSRAAHLNRMERYEALKPVPRREQPLRPGEITYKTHLEMAERGETKLRPVGAYEPGGYLGPIK